MNCYACPVKCGSDRSISKGRCKTGDNFIISHADLFMWEEPCVSGKQGSGAIFFGGCNLNCVYCQNYKISRTGDGRDVSIGELAEIVFNLAARGAHNINFVTPSHFTTQLAEFLKFVKPHLNIPVVYNSGGYDDADSLKSLEGLIDVYLPDFKYGFDEEAQTYSGVNNYVKVASRAVSEMLRQQPKNIFDDKGMIQKGVIVRHLILPNNVENSKKVLDILAQIDKDMYISLMSQYFPTASAANFPELNRPLKKREYDSVLEYFFNLGLKNGFMQEMSSADPNFVPVFNLIFNS